MARMVIKILPLIWLKIQAHLLVVEFTEVLLLDRLEIIESPQLTTVPLLIENVLNR